MLHTSVESSIDHVELLFSSQSHEVDSVSGNTDRQVGVSFWMIHGVQERIAIQHVDIHMVARAAKERIEHACQIYNPVLGNSSESLWDHRRSQRDSVGCVAIRDF